MEIRCRANASFSGAGFEVRRGEIVTVDRAAWEPFIRSGMLTPVDDDGERIFEVDVNPWTGWQEVGGPATGTATLAGEGADWQPPTLTIARGPAPAPEPFGPDNPRQESDGTFDTSGGDGWPEGPLVIEDPADDEPALGDRPPLGPADA